MISTSPFLTLEKRSDIALGWIIVRLQNAGFIVNHTFNLQDARHANPDCTCPHHGTDACECQMCVVLVYHQKQPPASLLIHSFQQTTWLYLIDSPDYPGEQKLPSVIRQVLVEDLPAGGK